MSTSYHDLPHASQQPHIKRPHAKVPTKSGLDHISKSSDIWISKLKLLTVLYNVELSTQYDVRHECCQFGGEESQKLSILSDKVQMEFVQFTIKLMSTYLVASYLPISLAEKLKVKKKFDVVLNMEIVEHVSDLNFFIKKSSELVKNNGLMFVATLNKTLKSYAFAIVGAEYILRWLPIGTHNWEKFVKPEDLIKISKRNNLEIKNLDGLNYDPLNNKWKVSSDNSVNYIAKFKKN